MGTVSSSSMVTTAPLTVKPEAVPDTARSSSPSSKSSETVVREKEADPLEASAGMVTVKLSTAVKSAASAP